VLIYVWGVHPGDHGYEVLLMMRDKYPEARAGILSGIAPLNLFVFYPIHLFGTRPLYGDTKPQGATSICRCLHSSAAEFRFRYNCAPREASVCRYLFVHLFICLLGTGDPTRGWAWGWRCGTSTPRTGTARRCTPRQGLTLVPFSAQPKPLWLHLSVSPSLIDWGEIMHPTYSTKCAYVEPKSGRV